MSDTTPHAALPPLPPPPPPLPPQAAEGWYEEPDELPPRPRARFFTPLTVVLMLVVFAACGFVGGVLVQKNQGSSTTTLGASTASSRFGAGASGATGSSGAASARGGFSRFASLFGGAGGAAGAGEAIGTVTDISGNKLYVTTAAGTMTEVITTPESKISKSESVGRKSIRPGDSVVVTGVTGNTGALTASTVTDSGSAGTSSSSGAFGGSGTTSTSGSASLFGGG